MEPYPVAGQKQAKRVKPNAGFRTHNMRRDSLQVPSILPVTCSLLSFVPLLAGVDSKAQVSIHGDMDFDSLNTNAVVIRNFFDVLFGGKYDE